MAGQETVRGGKFVHVNLISAGLDVNNDEFPLVPRFNMRTNRSLVYLVAASREFLTCTGV